MSSAFLLTLGLCYFFLFFYFLNESEANVSFGDVLLILPFLCLMSLLNYFIRYFRSVYILSKISLKLPFFTGLLSYLAPFLYTATPGKAGELIRVRYYSRLGISSQISISSFIYERFLDLLIVLIISFPVVYFTSDMNKYFYLCIAFLFSFLSLY